MNATESRTIRCMWVLNATLNQGPVTWTVTDGGGSVQWFTTQATVDSLVAQSMITVANGVGTLTVSGIAAAQANPIAWDGQC